MRFSPAVPRFSATQRTRRSSSGYGDPPEVLAMTYAYGEGGGNGACRFRCGVLVGKARAWVAGSGCGVEDRRRVGLPGESSRRFAVQRHDVRRAPWRQ